MKIDTKVVAIAIADSAQKLLDHIAELETENISLSRMVSSQDEGLAELEARIEAVREAYEHYMNTQDMGKLHWAIAPLEVGDE